MASNEFTAKKTHRHEEDAIQRGIVKFFRIQYPKHIIYAIPNGGRRGKLEASIMKGTGTLAGLPDLHIPHGYTSPLGTIKFHSLYIEVKTIKGKLSPAQINMIASLQDAGNRVELVRSIEEAIKIFKEYIG